MTTIEAAVLAACGILYLAAMAYAIRRETRRRAWIGRLTEAGFLTTEVPDTNQDRMARWVDKIEGRLRKRLWS